MKKGKKIHVIGGILLLIILGIIIFVFFRKKESSNKLLDYWYENNREIYLNEKYVDSFDNINRNFIILQKEEIAFCYYDKEDNSICEHGKVSINKDNFKVNIPNEELKGIYLYKIEGKKLKLIKEEDNKKIIIYYSMFEG